MKLWFVLLLYMGMRLSLMAREDHRPKVLSMVTSCAYVSEPRPPTGLLFIPQVIYKHGEPWWTDIERGEQKNSKKNLSQCHFVAHATDSGANPGFYGERPTTNRLSHGTASKQMELGWRNIGWDGRLARTVQPRLDINTQKTWKTVATRGGGGGEVISLEGRIILKLIIGIGCDGVNWHVFQNRQQRVLVTIMKLRVPYKQGHFSFDCLNDLLSPQQGLWSTDFVKRSWCSYHRSRTNDIPNLGTLV
jgi:hypothetical protein